MCVPLRFVSLFLFDSDVKARVVASSNMPLPDVNLVLCRYDQFLSTSEWFIYRQRIGAKLPKNFAQMRDYMQEDRRTGTKMPRMNKMDQRQKAVMNVKRRR
jgi:hypothetical protein